MQYLDNYLVMLFLGTLLGLAVACWALAEWR